MAVKCHVRRRIVGVVGLVTGLTAGLAGCGSPPARSEPDPAAPCTELARLIHRAEGREGKLCGPIPAEQRELIALGEGYLLDWVPLTGRQQIWKIDGARPLGNAPVAAGTTTFKQSEVLYPLGRQTLIAPALYMTSWRTYGVNVNAAGSNANLIQSRGQGTWTSPFWGHELVALDDDFVLTWWSGTGAYAVLKKDPASQELQTTDHLHGTLEALRRGAHIVNLGAHRLLEWIPVTGGYRIWSYHLDGAGPEIFDPEPVFPPAVWRDDLRPRELRPRDEILVVDQTPGAGRIAVWSRDDGRVVLRTFDPLAADPLGGAVIGDEIYPALASAAWDAPVKSRIENVVILLQRGRSFDSYFGQYCRGARGVTCHEGPDCCEAMPGSIPGAAVCAPLDVATDDHTPNDRAACLAAKINGGAMDGFATAPGCGSPLDFACAGTGPAAGAVDSYHRLATAGALGDRFFQTTIDGDALNAELNAIYLSKAGYGTDGSVEGGFEQLPFLLGQAGVRYAFYLGDPRDPRQTLGHEHPHFYDAHWTGFRAITELERDIALEQLPAVSVVFTPRGLNEQPGEGPAKAGIELVTGIVETIAKSTRYQPTTLVLVAYLTSGGYFDQVAPPASPPLSIDHRAANDPVLYGPRVPLLAVGRFARVGHVSHQPLELSSLAVFLEWNWLRPEPGQQLVNRARIVANLGSLLDPEQTGEPVPEVAPAIP